MSLTVRRELTVGKCHSSGVSDWSKSKRRRLSAGNASAAKIGGMDIVSSALLLYVQAHRHTGWCYCHSL
jgi:hypothetical protein